MSILAAIAPLSAAQAQATPDYVQISGTRLDVSAEGEVRRVPDIAMVSAGVMTPAATASAAMKENASRMTAVIAALRKAGVAEKDMQTSSVNLQPQYRYQENQPRSEEHTSELQSLMRISYAVFCLKTKNQHSKPTA